jgi:hypothetical protein
LRLCEHIHVGMIAPMRAYTRGHDSFYVGIYAWARSRLCVHTCLGMISPMCAGVCGHDRALCNENERFGILYVHVCASIYT